MSAHVSQLTDVIVYFELLLELLLHTCPRPSRVFELSNNTEQRKSQKAMGDLRNSRARLKTLLKSVQYPHLHTIRYLCTCTCTLF